MEEALTAAPQLPFWHHYTEVSFEDLSDPNHRITSTKLTCVLLQIKKHENKQTSKYSIYQNKGKGQSYFSNTLSVSYDRMFLFGLVYKRGFCIALLSQTVTASSFLVAKLNQNTSSIGSTIVILEPKYEEKSLGKNSVLPIIATSRHLFYTNVTEPFPSPYDLNLSIGQTRYFMLYQVSISLEGLIIINADCKGVQCDRLLQQGKDSKCGCFHSKLLSPLTVQTIVVVEEPPGQIAFSSDFQSYKLTQLLLTTTLESSLSEFEDENLENVRATVNNTVTHVNNHGGWNICGWMRLGSVIDAADVKAGEEVASDTVNPHIISLTPSNTTAEFCMELTLLRYRMN